MDEGGAGGDRPHRREADGGRCRVMGEGNRWDLGQVARRVVEGRSAERVREASAGPRTPARNVISVLCSMLASKLNTVSQCLLELPVFLTLTVFNRITLFSLNVTPGHYV